MPLADIPAALLTVTSNVGHYEAFQKTDKYIVWAEDGEAGSLNADDRKQIQALQGTIDYFTKTEYDPNVSAIQIALDDAEIYWRLNSVQCEDNTGYIHYEWVFEVM